MGKANSLRSRISSYFTNKSSLGEKTRLMVNQVAHMRITIVESELEALLLEAAYIKKNNPKYNSRLADGKEYPLIRITIKEKYPKVLIARRPDDKKSLYFGPYPSSSAMKMVLKILRKIFPYENVLKHPKKPCLYYHLGLCPCADFFDSPEIKKQYKKNVRHIVQFLNGEKQKVLKELEAERNQQSNAEQYEEAKKTQNKIDSVLFVTSPVHKPFEYEINPNLREDIRSEELVALQNHLSTAGVTVNYLHKIECYDISNTSGTNATGSLVVLSEGELNKSLYRKFKIKKTKGPDDFAMMAEMLIRRLKHTEWEYPDLIVVDGGKGQISAALRVLNNLSLTIPLVGLAKREETIITSDFKEISLPKDSKALHLVQRIRDEAHRFAITYHRKLRSKATYA